MSRSEERIEAMRKAALSHQPLVIEGVKVDAFFARRISALYEQVNEQNRSKLDSLSVDKLMEVVIRMMDKKEMVQA